MKFENKPIEKQLETLVFLFTSDLSNLLPLPF